MNESSSVARLAVDLSKKPPRSPRALLGGFVVAARTLDKCRAVLADSAGEYHYDCPLDQTFLGFSGITGDEFRAKVAEGLTDEEMDGWIQSRTEHLSRDEIIQWNNKMRDQRISEMPGNLQAFLEDYIPANVPNHRPVYVWFDVYDLEEGRL